MNYQNMIKNKNKIILYMSSGSNNSNFGYGKYDPYGSNVNPEFVNKWSSNNPANFGSNEVSGLPGLSGAKNNVDAAAGIVRGIGLFKGGYKKLKSKIKNITKRYKRSMHKNKRSAKKYVRSIKSRIKAKYGGKHHKMTSSRRHKHSHSKKHKKCRLCRTLKGGYSQYQNNFPMTPSYSVGGVLSSSNLALANPPPIQQLPNCVNCVDNYSRYLNTGFASKGH
jgi:hypothetical protein